MTKSAAPFGGNGLTVYSGSVTGWRGTRPARSPVEAEQRVGEPVRRLAQPGGASRSAAAPAWGEQHVLEGSGDRPEHEQERARQETAMRVSSTRVAATRLRRSGRSRRAARRAPARGRGRPRARPAECGEQPGLSTTTEPRGPRPARASAERVVDEVQARGHDPTRRASRSGAARARRLRCGELASPDHADARGRRTTR